MNLVQKVSMLIYLAHLNLYIHEFYLIKLECLYMVNSKGAIDNFESTNANGREPKSCLGRVFNFKLGCFVMCMQLHSIYKHAQA